jgi:microcystin-dependent protein
MSQPFVGEIRLFAGNFAPVGWMLCQGQLLPISENETLFQLIGTTYGGDGQETFALPDLQSRVPIHVGSGFVLGETGGVEDVTLTVNQIPTHSHPLLATTAAANDGNPANKLLGESRPGSSTYYQDFTSGNMAATAISPVGGSQPHTNFQPYLCLNFIISLFGIFPPPN